MSTSDSPKGGAEPSADRQASLVAAAAGLPDPAILERLANEFFRGNPAANMPVDMLTLPSAPLGAATIPTEPTLTEAQLQAIPATLTAAPVMTPGIPGGFSTSDLMTATNFSFLSDARSIYASAPAVPVHAAPVMDTLKIPYETDLRALETSFNGVKAPAIPASSNELSAPQIPGMADVHNDAGSLAEFDFLEILNPLEPTTAVATVGSIPSDPTAAKLVSSLSSVPFDVNAIRRDFPILQEKVNGRQLVWLDNAATTHKPQSVIDRLSFFYAHENSNIHRAAHTLAARATDAYEAAREKVRRFLNASSAKEIIFVRGATEAINLVAQSWGRRNIQKDDEIVITWLEHHANIVPWQMLCAEKGAKLRVAPVDNSGQVLLEEYEELLNPRTRLVAFAHVSNALGTVTPVEEMIAAAHRHGAKVLVDGAQAVSHLRVDVQEYDCDFYVFSGHKVFAPTGIGVVYGKAEVLESTPPWQGGGNMITDVTFEKTQYQTPPGRFEAGTGSIGDAVGLGAAIDYVERIGMANIARYEHDLLVYATDALQRIPGLRLIGTAKEKASVLSFVLDGFRTEDVGAALNQEGIAVRSGHHCAQPILRRFGVESTVRPSLALYNTCEDVDALVTAIWNLKGGRNPGML
ncbi:MAG: family 2A encapsulin nanocompartment cargo protein cysteine desulfurase [Tepidisphaeraceae bacterium]|jgi:cysteine desulfurase/selenocysteine lyase